MLIHTFTTPLQQQLSGLWIFFNKFLLRNFIQTVFADLVTPQLLMTSFRKTPLGKQKRRSFVCKTTTFRLLLHTVVEVYSPLASIQQQKNFTDNSLLNGRWQGCRPNSVRNFVSRGSRNGPMVCGRLSSQYETKGVTFCRCFPWWLFFQDNLFFDDKAAKTGLK